MPLLVRKGHHQVLTRAGQCGRPEPEGRVLHAMHAQTEQARGHDFHCGLKLVMPCTVISVIMPPLHVKEGMITEKVFPVFSESFFWTCFGLVMYIWELMGVTEKLAFQM